MEPGTGTGSRQEAWCQIVMRVRAYASTFGRVALHGRPGTREWGLARWTGRLAERYDRGEGSQVPPTQPGQMVQRDERAAGARRGRGRRPQGRIGVDTRGRPTTPSDEGAARRAARWRAVGKRASCGAPRLKCGAECAATPLSTCVCCSLRPPAGSLVDVFTRSVRLPPARNVTARHGGAARQPDSQTDSQTDKQIDRQTNSTLARRPRASFAGRGPPWVAHDSVSPSLHQQRAHHTLRRIISSAARPRANGVQGLLGGERDCQCMKPASSSPTPAVRRAPSRRHSEGMRRSMEQRGWEPGTGTGTGSATVNRERAARTLRRTQMPLSPALVSSKTAVAASSQDAQGPAASDYSQCQHHEVRVQRPAKQAIMDPDQDTFDNCTKPSEMARFRWSPLPPSASPAR
ncbi:hypothetical protein P154DRAFT_528362 [Amniculicola lignicola CBS 123094]|uniref:Uncharacterized protein n=1 Tax=Amniculicola lignicola CBS 123094 TaxID=1392246 RepID=A0A6A5X409_9PLEO|nr:hypothetical protein P154DRAFT_528362 [Amniculicola lignicola CBS 123094]